MKTKEVNEHTHTYTHGKVLIHGPRLGRRRRCIDCAQATNEKSIGVSLTERRGQKRSAGCPCLCQGMAELAADTQYPLSRTWPGGSTVCTKPRGHSEARRLASWTTCLVSGHGKCFIHQPETHTFTSIHMCLTYSQVHKFNFTIHKGPSSVKMVLVEKDTSFYVMINIIIIFSIHFKWLIRCKICHHCNHFLFR